MDHFQQDKFTSFKIQILTVTVGILLSGQEIKQNLLNTSYATSILSSNKA